MRVHRIIWKARYLGAISLCGLWTASALSQSLYLRPTAIPLDERGEPNVTLPLNQFSMMIVAPEEPPSFEVHDLVTIVVNESSQQQREQTMETERESSNLATIRSFPDVNALLREATFRDGVTSNFTPLDLEASSEFEGEATYERSDSVTTRITAEIIDVKPNGVLVLEARTRIQTDDEIQEFRLSGSCRQEDITGNNTVQSSQLFNLRIETHHEGELRESTRKGWLTKFIDRVSPF